MENKAKQGLLPELWHLVRTHIRDYAMFIALAVIFILFGAFTQGNFLSPRNLTNLINQTGYIAVMACAMTLLLIIRQIDLSVGCAAGFTGAIAAIPPSSRRWPLNSLSAAFCRWSLRNREPFRSSTKASMPSPMALSRRLRSVKPCW